MQEEWCSVGSSLFHYVPWLYIPALKLGRLSYVSLRLVLYIWLKDGVFAPAEGAICVMILPQKVGHAPCFVYVFSRVALLEPL